MRAALIPPVPELAQYGQGNFHLLLSHLFKRPAYVKHYKQQRACGAYLVLDNSAHEKQAGEAATLLRDQALLLNAQEVVVPDVLFGLDATVESAVNALEVWYEDDGDRGMHDLNPALMYVPQGRNEEEWAECLQVLTRLHVFMAKRVQFRSDFVIGVSKDYDEMVEGGLPHLLREYVAPLRKYQGEGGIKMHVHMLGWPRRLQTLQDVSTEFKWVRSTDSAKPFVYAMAGDMLHPGTPVFPPYPKRPYGYFGKTIQSEKIPLVENNIALFKKFAGA